MTTWVATDSELAPGRQWDSLATRQGDESLLCSSIPCNQRSRFYNLPRPTNVRIRGVPRQVLGGNVTSLTPTEGVAFLLWRRKVDQMTAEH